MSKGIGPVCCALKMSRLCSIIARWKEESQGSQAVIGPFVKHKIGIIRS